MIIRSLLSDDWVFGRGNSSYNLEDSAIAENIQTRLRCFLGDCFFDAGAGIDWFRLLGIRGSKAELVLACRFIILNSFGVVRVNTIDANVNENRRLTLSISIDTIFSQQYILTIGVS
jgi:hypothetical protein